MDRTPREYLTFVARAKRVPRAEIEAQVEHAMEMTQITHMADRLIKNLSKGYKQRVGIAQAVLGNPEIIILDEPTVGLDPAQIIEIRSLIQQLGQEHTVILSSHILSEVQAVCQTILIISRGHLVACDTPENLEKRFTGTTTIRLTAECGEAQLRELLCPLSDIDTLEITETDDSRTSATLTAARSEDEAICRAIFFACSASGVALLQLASEKASLEDIFIELTNAPTETAADETDEEADEAVEIELVEAEEEEVEQA